MTKRILPILLLVAMSCGGQPPTSPSAPNPEPTPPPPSPSPSTIGALAIHPDNPHYFQDSVSGRPVVIASYWNIVPTSTDFDYVADIQKAVDHHVSYCRIWHFLPWGGSHALWPWALSNQGGAYMGGRGGKKFDMNTWDDGANSSHYWFRMRDTVSRMNIAGKRASIMLFDGVGLAPAGDERWGGNPWARDNNVNDLEVPGARPPLQGTPDFYLYGSKPNLREQQERYVKKMIDETIAFPNVIYEIENEHRDYDNPDWFEHYGAFVKQYLADAHPGNPRLVSYSSLDDDLEYGYNSRSIDIVNKHFGKAAEQLTLRMTRRAVAMGLENPSALAELEAQATAEAQAMLEGNVLSDYIQTHYNYGKPINIDEFANGVTSTDILRKMCWTIFANGAHFHIEDASQASNPWGVVENMRNFLDGSNFDFVHAEPRRDLVAGGFMLAQSGVEYVAYFQSGGHKVINLAPGTYNVEWWNPRSGGFSNATTITHDGGDKTFDTPDNADWVLHLVRP